MISSLRHARIARTLIGSLLVGSALLSSACTKKAKSGLDDLAYDPNAHNVALLYGAPNGLAGVDRDMTEMESTLLREEYGFHFDVKVDRAATTEAILAGVAEQAAAVGPTGTLIVYLSGHGSKDGRFITVGGSLTFDRLADAIMSARETPLKRLLILNDSCFSGIWNSNNGVLGTGLALDGDSLDEVEAADAIAAKSMDAMYDAMDSYKASRGGVLAEQILVFSAASSAETAADTGAANGGAFTYSFRTVLDELAAKKDTAKISDLIDLTVNRTKERWHHTPQANVLPKAMGDELVFGLPPAPEPEPQPEPVDPFAAEKAHFDLTLAALNSGLDGCTVKLVEMTKNIDLAGRYYFRFAADYKDGQESEIASSWGDSNAKAEAEAKEFLKVIPTKYFASCKHKGEAEPPPAPITDIDDTEDSQEFAAEHAHATKTVAAVTEKLWNCDLHIKSVDQGVNASGYYRFTMYATYWDGTESETRSVSGKLAASTHSEMSYFLRYIPSRYFTQCELIED